MLAQALREVGCDAHALSYRVDWDGRRSDIVVDLDARRTAGDARARDGSRRSLRSAPRFDVFHFHFGTSFLPRLLDVPLAARDSARTIVFHFHGCEVRRPRPHAASTTGCRPAPSATRSAGRGTRRGCARGRRGWRRPRVLLDARPRRVGARAASTCRSRSRRARWERGRRREHAAAGARRARRRARTGRDRATRPTNRLIKGTRHVDGRGRGAARASSRGSSCALIEQPAVGEMPEFLAGCDILVDQLHMGWYGLLAIEGHGRGEGGGGVPARRLPRPRARACRW